MGFDPSRPLDPAGLLCGAGEQQMARAECLPSFRQINGELVKTGREAGGQKKTIKPESPKTKRGHVLAANSLPTHNGLSPYNAQGHQLPQMRRAAPRF